MCNGTSAVLVLSALQLLKVANGEEHSSSMKTSTADLKAFNISGFVDGFTTRMCSGTISPQTLEILKGMTAASMGHADEAMDSPNYQHCFNIASMLSEQLMEVGIGNRPLRGRGLVRVLSAFATPVALGHRARASPAVAETQTQPCFS